MPSYYQSTQRRYATQSLLTTKWVTVFAWVGHLSVPCFLIPVCTTCYSGPSIYAGSLSIIEEIKLFQTKRLRINTSLKFKEVFIPTLFYPFCRQHNVQVHQRRLAFLKFILCHISLVVNVCFCYIRFSLFSTMLSDWLGRTSPKMTYFVSSGT